MPGRQYEERFHQNPNRIWFGLGWILFSMSNIALAQKRCNPGASDREIKISNTEPYSGPASACSVVAKTQDADFKMINDKGGINGRLVNFISYDDAFSPPKTVEQTRKLVENDEALFAMGGVGTAANAAIHKYMNQKQALLRTHCQGC